MKFENFKRARRAVIMPVLKSVRKFLNVLKQYAFPNYRSQLNVYDLYKEEQIKKCYEHFKNYLKNAVLLSSDKIREHALNCAKEKDNDPNSIYIEFGVFSGSSINFFSNKIKKNIYGFDSFEGLREDWLGTSVPKGTFNLNKKIPKLNNNVIPIVGWIQDTLPKFLEDKNPKICFIHMDVDTYESSKFILEKVKPYLENETIILFDEIYNFEGWDVGEYKALKDVFDDDEFSFISFSKDTAQAAIRIFKR